MHPEIQSLARFFPLRFSRLVRKRIFAKANKRRQCLHEKRISFVYFSYLSNMVEWIALRLYGFTAEEPFLLSPNIANNGFLYSYNNPPEYSEFIDRKQSAQGINDEKNKAVSMRFRLIMQTHSQHTHIYGTQYIAMMIIIMAIFELTWPKTSITTMESENTFRSTQRQCVFIHCCIMPMLQILCTNNELLNVSIALNKPFARELNAVNQFLGRIIEVLRLFVSSSSFFTTSNLSKRGIKRELSHTHSKIYGRPFFLDLVIVRLNYLAIQ